MSLAVQYSACFYLCQIVHRQLVAHALGGGVTDAQNAFCVCQALLGAQCLMCMTLCLLLQTSAASGLHALKCTARHAAALMWHVCQCTLSSNKGCFRSPFGISLLPDVGVELAKIAA